MKKTKIKSAAPKPLQWPVHWIAVAVLLALAWIGFSNTLENGFVWDDHELVVRNADVRGGTVLKIFGSGAWAFQQPGQISANNNYYRPLQILTYRCIAALAGMSPYPFHLASLLLHCGAVLLVYAVFFKLLKAWFPALAGACLFAVHPIHTEAIDWVACSTELGCALFLLLAFYGYLAGHRILSLAAFLAALLWKEMAATLPLLIAAHALLVERSPLKKTAVATIAYWLVLVLYLFLRHNALGVFYASPANWTVGPFAFALTVLRLTADYWWKLIWPLDLNVYHVFDANASPNVLQVILIGALIAFVVYAYKRWPLAAFGCAWVFLALLPVLNVYHLGSNVFGERYLYIPSVGLCLVAAWLASRYRAWPVAAAFGLIVVLYVTEDRARANDWTDDYVLFSKTATASPRSAVVQNVLGDLLRTERNDVAGAEQHYRQALTDAREAHPPQLSQLSIAYVGLAHVLDETRQFPKALEALDEAQRINPANASADLARAVILAEQEDWQPSKRILVKLLQADPNNEAALNTMGMVAWQGEHNNAAALGFFERSLAAGGTDVTAASTHNNLGAVYGDQRQYEKAIAEFHRAAELDPQNPEYPANLGNLFGMLHQRDAAAASFQRALQIAPGYPPAQEGLAHLQAEEKNQ